MPGCLGGSCRRRYIGSVLFGTLWTVQAWGRPQVLPSAVAVALPAAAVVMSVVLLVPINSRVARWSDGAELPADWRRQVGQWDRVHYVRVGINITAFVLLVMAGTACDHYSAVLGL